MFWGVVWNSSAIWACGTYWFTAYGGGQCVRVAKRGRHFDGRDHLEDRVAH